MSSSISPFQPRKLYLVSVKIKRKVSQYFLISLITRAFLNCHLMLKKQFGFLQMYFIYEGSLFESTCLDLRAV